MQLEITDAAQDEVDDTEHVASVTHTTPAVSIGSRPPVTTPSGRRPRSNQPSLEKTLGGLSESLRSNVDLLRDRLDNRTSDPIYHMNAWAASTILQLPPAAQRSYQDELYKLVRGLEDRYRHQPVTDSQQPGPSMHQQPQQNSPTYAQLNPTNPPVDESEYDMSFLHFN